LEHLFKFSEIASKRLILSPGKTAAGLLNEICPNLTFEFSEQEGPPHDPMFSVTVTYPVLIHGLY